MLEAIWIFFEIFATCVLLYAAIAAAVVVVAVVRDLFVRGKE